jgi:hypothetical protein
MERTATVGTLIIWLINRGPTTTGESLDEIFARIHGKILREVSMS